MTSSPLLSVRNLRKVYRSAVAVHDVSFDLGSGESLAIVGESGSGKSTVAQIVVGLVAASAGTVALHGIPRDFQDTRRAARRLRAREVQLVFQDPYGSLDPSQTVRAALAEVLLLHHGLAGRAQALRVAELLEQVGLGPAHGAARPRDLSGGQRQRVAIARALAAEPEVLILDEAVAALDVSVQAQILNLLKDIRARTPIAYLFVSHDLAVVRQISDRTIVMQAGRVVEEGPTADVLDRPQADYTRALRAAAPGPGWVPRRRPLTVLEVVP